MLTLAVVAAALAAVGWVAAVLTLKARQAAGVWKLAARVRKVAMQSGALIAPAVVAAAALTAPAGV